MTAVTLEESKSLPERRSFGSTARLPSPKTESPDRTIILNAPTPDQLQQSSDRSSVSSVSSADSSFTGSPPVSRSNSITRGEQPTRKRRRTSPDELQILEYEFARNSRPCKEDRERIAALTSKDEKAVQVWFQNKRQSFRRLKSGSGMVPALVRSISYTEDLVMPNGQIIPALPMQYQPASGAYFGYAFAQPQVPQSTQQSVQQLNHQSVPHAQQPIQHAPPADPSLDFSQQPSQPTPPQDENAATVLAKRSKSLKLSMSADGKAEIVERSPLKVINTNRAQKFSSAPADPTGFEQECASSLLVLKSGHW